MFGRNYLRRPNEVETAQISEQNEAREFPRMLGGIGTERIVHLVGKDCTKGTQESVVLGLKLWQIMNYGFSTLSLAWHDLIMTSTCCSALRCLRNLLKGMLRRSTMRSMAASTTKGYYLDDGIYPKWSDRKSVV